MPDYDDRECEAELVIDFDSITCDLPIHHEGMHRGSGEGGRFDWQLYPTE